MDILIQEHDNGFVVRCMEQTLMDEEVSFVFGGEFDALMKALPQYRKDARERMLKKLKEKEARDGSFSFVAETRDYIEPDEIDGYN